MSGQPVTGYAVETWERALESIALRAGENYLRVVADDGPTDVEVRIPLSGLDDFARYIPAVADLIEAGRRAERLLRDMADAGFGEHQPANELRNALSRIGESA